MAESTFVPNWHGDALQAARVSAGNCDAAGGEMLVCLDMHASDGAPFAHAHFDIDTAMQIFDGFAQAIEAACRARQANAIAELQRGAPCK